MRFLSKAKDGGPESTVTGYWLVEIKKLFSVVLLKFEDGSRDAYHSHAFNSLNWVLAGRVVEYVLPDPGDTKLVKLNAYEPALRPVLTGRNRFHKVVSRGNTWVLSIRGPWKDTWLEWIPRTGRFETLTHGRKVQE